MYDFVYPDDLRYTGEHEWVRVTVGAQGKVHLAGGHVLALPAEGVAHAVDKLDVAQPLVAHQDHCVCPGCPR